LEDGFHRCLLLGGKKGGLAVGPTKRGKGTKIVAIATDHSLPPAVSIQSASPHESQLVDHSFLEELPERLIGDSAYDSDALDDHLLETYGIELIAPHPSNLKRITQDGRPFRRYSRRWCRLGSRIDRSSRLREASRRQALRIHHEWIANRGAEFVELKFNLSRTVGLNSYHPGNSFPRTRGSKMGEQEARFLAECPLLVLGQFMDDNFQFEIDIERDERLTNVEYMRV
jgi:hypothetical protein